MPPVLISKQSSTTFSDKEQVWADNASSSPFFGTVYVCWASFRGQEKGNAAPAPLHRRGLARRRRHWSQHQITPAANNGQRNPLDGCTIRTDSRGTAYVFGVGTVVPGGKQPFEFMSRSTNGGSNWSQPQPVAGPVHAAGRLRPGAGPSGHRRRRRRAQRPRARAERRHRQRRADRRRRDQPDRHDATSAGRWRRRTCSSPSPPTAARPGRRRGRSRPRATAASTRRRRSRPNGTDVYVVYNAFTTPFQTTTRHAALAGRRRQARRHRRHGRRPGRSASSTAARPGDPRASSANALTAEFLGDYVYAAATRTYGAAVWNDTRNGADCPAIDAWRQALQNGQSPPAPAPQQRVPGDVRQLRHLRRHLPRPDAVAGRRGGETRPRAGPTAPSPQRQGGRVSDDLGSLRDARYRVFLAHAPPHRASRRRSTAHKSAEVHKRIAVLRHATRRRLPGAPLSRRGIGTCRPRIDHSGPSPRGSSDTRSRRQRAHRSSSADDLRAPQSRCCCLREGRP